MMIVAYSTTVGCTANSSGSFQNNAITGNVFQDAAIFGPPFSAMEIDLAGMQAGIGGNLIQGNDFGTQIPGPSVVPLSAFTDGGGNVCARGGNLQCSASGPAPSSLPTLEPYDLLPSLKHAKPASQPPRAPSSLNRRRTSGVMPIRR
jgi:hypothetical protein